MFVKDAGVRNDPPMSEPSPAGWIPAAMTAATPPEEPEADLVMSLGFTVVPKTVLKVCDPAASSGTFVLPVEITPAACSRSMIRDDVVGTLSAKSGEPFTVGSPAASLVSLCVIGTPCSGGSAAPEARR